jgi:hypothetical protein
VVTDYEEGSISNFLGSNEFHPAINSYELTPIIISTLLGVVIIILKKVKISKHESTI